MLSKIRPDFGRKVVIKLKLPKNHFSQNVLLKSYSSMKKKNPMLALCDELASIPGRL
jgi:hypothetical protein